MHKRVRKRFQRNPYLVCNIDDQWQADLVDMQSLQKYNDGYRYILTVIDLFSRYAWAVPVRSKTGEYIVKALEKIFASTPGVNLYVYKQIKVHSLLTEHSTRT